MEYELFASRAHAPAHIAQVVLNWYAQTSSTGPLAAHSPFQSFRPFSPAQAVLSPQRPIFGNHTSSANTRPTARLPASAQPAGLAKGPLPPGAPRSATEFNLGPGVRVHQLSALGGLTQDYFVWLDTDVLVVDRLSHQHRWVRLKSGWNHPVQAPSFSSTDLVTTQPVALSVGQMTEVQKLTEAIRRAASADRVGAQARDFLLSLISPENLKVMAFIAACYGVSLYFGVGEVFTAVVFVGGVVLLGEDLIGVAELLYKFYKTATEATSSPQLDEAADYLAEAVVRGTADIVQIFTAIKTRPNFLRRGQQRAIIEKKPTITDDTPTSRRGVPDEPAPPPSKPTPRPDKPTPEPAPDAKPAKATKKSLRDQYLGRTPGKSSATGRKVIERMRNERPPRIRERNGKTQFKSRKDGKWYDIADADMAHYPTDAVEYWNTTGKNHGQKSKKVRDWMNDPNNYELEHYSHNRSDGAKLGKRYDPPPAGTN